MAPNNLTRTSVALFGCLIAGGYGCATEISGGSGGEGGGPGTTAVTTVASTTVATTQAATTSGMGCPQNCAEVEGPPCTKGVCNMATGTCDFEPADDGAACEDGLFCTDGDECIDGECVGGPLPDCGSSEDPCLQTICDEEADECSVGPKPNGASCIADDPCSANAICQNGNCLGAPKDCSAAPVPDECHVAVCDPMQNGDCVPIIGNNGLTCSSFGDPCMVQKVCDQGACVGGVPKDCSSFTNGCNNGVCEAGTGVCFSEPVAPGGTCLEATDACNIGICDMNGACIGQPANNGATCNDGSSCTVNDVCGAGTCAGVPDPNYTIYFSDAFASNNQGWTLGTEWQIGPATLSDCTTDSPGEDPATDHTASADDGIAGVVIGGCYSTAGNHPPYCMTSPPIDANPPSGSVHLSYYRHLHSDYPGYMYHRVQVSADGTTWNTVYEVPASEVQNDTDWTFASFDVTAFKSATFQVRFCHEINNPPGGIYQGGGWNVDDVVIASSACP